MKLISLSLSFSWRSARHLTWLSKVTLLVCAALWGPSWIIILSPLGLLPRSLSLACFSVYFFHDQIYFTPWRVLEVSGHPGDNSWWAHNSAMGSPHRNSGTLRDISSLPMGNLAFHFIRMLGWQNFPSCQGCWHHIAVEFLLLGSNAWKHIWWVSQCEQPVTDELRVSWKRGQVHTSSNRYLLC